MGIELFCIGKLLGRKMMLDASVQIFCGRVGIGQAGSALRGRPAARLDR